MEFSELVKLRQSSRAYTSNAIEKEKLLQCIESARLAPSANNSQPWKLIVVDDPILKEQIAGCASGLGMNRFTHQAPVIVAVVLEKQKILSSIASVIKDKEFCLLDVGIMVNQFCLQAADLGLATCIIGWFDEKKVKTLLNVKSSKRVPLLITVGYSDTPVREKIRNKTEIMSSWNQY